jgi:hypothetical protein
MIVWRWDVYRGETLTYTGQVVTADDVDPGDAAAAGLTQAISAYAISTTDVHIMRCVVTREDDISITGECEGWSW